MSTQRDTLSARVEADVRARVERYRDERDKDSMSEATEELVRVGLREQQGVVGYYLRERALDASWYLSLVGAVIIIVGATTSLLPAGEALTTGMTLGVVSVAPLALVEAARAVTGQSPIATLWRRES